MMENMRRNGKFQGKQKWILDKLGVQEIRGKFVVMQVQARQLLLQGFEKSESYFSNILEIKCLCIVSKVILMFNRPSSPGCSG